jgi:hypothetical protein
VRKPACGGQAKKSPHKAGERIKPREAVLLQIKKIPAGKRVWEQQKTRMEAGNKKPVQNGF